MIRRQPTTIASSPTTSWIEVEDFPVFIVIDDKGNDFFQELNLG
jgi:hypothetical protein